MQAALAWPLFQLGCYTGTTLALGWLASSAVVLTVLRSGQLHESDEASSCLSDADLGNSVLGCAHK